MLCDYLCLISDSPKGCYGGPTKMDVNGNCYGNFAVVGFTKDGKVYKDNFKVFYNTPIEYLRQQGIIDDNTVVESVVMEAKSKNYKSCNNHINHGWRQNVQ